MKDEVPTKPEPPQPSAPERKPLVQPPNEGLCDHWRSAARYASHTAAPPLGRHNLRRSPV